MDKDWQRGSMYVKEPKVTKELGVGKDGYQTGGVTTVSYTHLTLPTNREV